MASFPKPPAVALTEKGAANGVATLDGSGRIPISQLTVDAVEYKGTWNATTNSPTLANGTGSAGDLYRVSASGEHNFGAGSISFSVGDYVIYNGSAWEKIGAAEGGEAALPDRYFPLGNVSGAFEPDLDDGNIFPLTLVGDASITDLLNIDSGLDYQEVALIVTMGGEGDYSLTAPGEWEEGGSLPLSPEVGKKTTIWLYIENGADVTVARPPRGEKSTVPGPQGIDGAKGDKGGDGKVGPPGATGNTAPVREVSGTVVCDLSESTFAHRLLVTGDTVIDVTSFTGWPAGDVQAVLYIDEDATGGHKITVNGPIWLPDNKAPTFDTAPGAHNIIPLASPDGGATVFGDKDLLNSEAEGDVTGPFYNLKVATVNSKAVSKVVFTEDSRLSDARTPSAHASSHQKGGSDPLYLFGDNWLSSARAENSPLVLASAGSNVAEWNPTVTSGRIYLLYFTPHTTMTISELLVCTPNLTPQFVYTGETFTRLGIFALTNPDTSSETAVLVARTGKSTAIGVAKATIYPVALAEAGGFPLTYKLERGTRYAFAIYSNASTMGKLTCCSRMPATVAGGTSYPPFKIRTVEGESDLPTATIGSGQSKTIGSAVGDMLWMGAK